MWLTLDIVGSEVADVGGCKGVGIGVGIGVGEGEIGVAVFAQKVELLTFVI